METDYEKLRQACEEHDMLLELKAYQELLTVQSGYTNTAKAVLRNLIADITGLEDEFVQVSCEEEAFR